MNPNRSPFPEEHEMERARMIFVSDDMLDDGSYRSALKEPQASHKPVHPGPDGTRKTRKSRWHALVKSLVLLPPLAISLAILILNFRGVFWSLPSEHSNNILSALQFAASLHAALIVGSISAMVLSLIQYGLAGKAGIPLGFISASHNVDSLFYLFRNEFRALSFRYLILFPIAVAVALASAPSSAILMIPRLQFWSIDNVWVGKGHLDFGVYIQASHDNLYPETLTAQYSPPQCAQANASILEECPSFGIRQWIMDGDVLQTSASPPHLNKTINGDWVRYLVGQPTSVNVGSQSSYASASLSTFLGNVMLAYDNILSSAGQLLAEYDVGAGTVQQHAAYDNVNTRMRYDLSFRSAGKDVATRKPVVEVQCQGYPANATNLVLQRDSMQLASRTGVTSADVVWGVAASTYSSLASDLNSTIVNSSWIDTNQFGSFKPSLGSIFTTPEILHGGTYIDDKTPFSFFICTIDARWMTTQTYLDIATNDRFVYDSFPDPTDAIYGEETSYHTVKEISATHAYIDESWANLLSVPWVDSLRNQLPTNRSILDIVGQKCLDTQTYLNATFLNQITTDNGSLHRVANTITPMLHCLQTSLSVYVTDALARAQNSVPTYIAVDGQLNTGRKISRNQDLYADPQELRFQTPATATNLTEDDFKDANRFTEIHMKVSRYGYWYGFQDSILIFFGAVILLLHIVMCVAYLVWVMVVEVPAGLQAETISELLVLGMQSGSDGTADSVTLKDAKKNPKKLWTGRYRLRDAEVEPQNLMSAGAAKRTGNLVLRRIARAEKEDGLR